MATERAAELATAFALGDLDEAGMRELLGLLQDGVHGAAHAAAAWEALTTTIDLRATMSHAVPDAVVLRLAEGDGDFAARLRERIGVARARLQPVAPPAPPAPVRRARWPWVVFAAAIVAGALLAAYLLRPSPPPPLATIIDLAGPVQAGGRIVVAGGSLGGEAVAVPAGGHLTLRWQDGTTAALRGPAAALIQPGGVTLASGRLTAHTAGPWSIGLPTARIEAAAATVCTVAADEPARVGVDAGRAQVGGIVLASGHAWSGGNVQPWRDEPVSAGPIPTAGLHDWRLRCTVRWLGPDGVLTIGDVRIMPGRVHADGRDAVLSGAALADDEVWVVPGPDGMQVRVRGLAVPLVGRPAWSTTGAVQVEARLIAGPER